MNRFAMIGVILCLQPTAPAMQAPPAPTTYYPLIDTFVKSDTPTLSYGVEQYLSAEEDPAIPVTERLYIRFSAPDLMGKTVTSAILRVRVVRENGGGGATDNFELLGVTSAWFDTMTWTQSLSVTTGPVVTTVPVLDYGATNTLAPSQLLDFTVTSLVQSWAAGTTNNGLMIRLAAGGKADMRFASSESIERPELIVNFGAPAPPPPPPGPPPPPPPPRTQKVGGEDNPCGCGSTSPLQGAACLAVLAVALILATRRL